MVINKPCDPNRVADVSGAMMYDHIAGVGPGWTVLVADADGRPAIMEGRSGHGRILVFEPSYERYYTGADVDGSADRPEFAKLFENIVAYVVPK